MTGSREEGQGMPGALESHPFGPWGSAGNQGLLFRACQSNSASWKFKRGQKEADFKTHLSGLAALPAPLREVDPAPPRLSCPGPVLVEMKPDRSGSRGKGWVAGKRGGGVLKTLTAGLILGLGYCEVPVLLMVLQKESEAESDPTPSQTQFGGGGGGTMHLQINQAELFL